MNLILWLQFIHDKYCYGQPDALTFAEWRKINRKDAPTQTPPWRALIAFLGLFLCSCGPTQQTSDDVQREQQERILKEGTSAVGMPAIHNFREKRLLKDIIELRDQESLTTYTYIVSEMNGKLIYLGESIGYGIPAATQFTNPQKYERVNVSGGGYGYQTLPQADPNGLFSPASADGTWVMMKDPNGDKVVPVYIEPRVIVSPFKLNIN